MRQTRKNALRGSVFAALSLLTFLFAVVIPEHAGARQNRGEGYITGYSVSDFSGVGHIDDIREDRLVIDDCSKMLSSGVKYYKPGPIGIPLSAFVVGSRVGYVEDRNGTIISLWLLPDSKKRKNSLLRDSTNKKSRPVPSLKKASE